MLFQLHKVLEFCLQSRGRSRFYRLIPLLAICRHLAFTQDIRSMPVDIAITVIIIRERYYENRGLMFT